MMFRSAQDHFQVVELESTKKGPECPRITYTHTDTSSQMWVLK